MQFAVIIDALYSVHLKIIYQMENMTIFQFQTSQKNPLEKNLMPLWNMNSSFYTQPGTGHKLLNVIRTRN